MQHPRAIDGPLVDAYLARRALDYLVGFTLSPVLWRKLPGARSAGRVQSVALRLVCDRELEIEAFKAAGILDDRGRARDGQERDLPGAPALPSTARSSSKFDITTKRRPSASRPRSKGGRFAVSNIESKSQRRNPAPPFTTSTLQQEASRKLGFSPTPHHADRPAALRRRRPRRRDRGPHHLHANRRRADRARGHRRLRRLRRASSMASATCPRRPRHYKTKAKNAQEAHEAIRPTDFTKAPDMRRPLSR